MAAVELSLPAPVKAWVAPLARVTLADGAEMVAVRVLRGAGVTVTVRVAVAVTPVLSLTVRVTVSTALAVPVLVKVWLAEAPVAVPPSPKVQA